MTAATVSCCAPPFSRDVSRIRTPSWQVISRPTCLDSCSIRSSTTAATRCRSEYNGCTSSSDRIIGTPPAKAILLAWPFTSERIARVWQPDFTTSVDVLCRLNEARIMGMIPSDETVRALSSLLTMIEAIASKMKGSSFAFVWCIWIAPTRGCSPP